MKRIITHFVIFIMLFSALGGVVSAASEVPEEEYTEDAPAEETPTAQPPAEEPTFADRLSEYIDSGKVYELLGLAASLVMIVLAYYLKSLMSKIGNKMLGAVKTGSDKINDSAQTMADATAESRVAFEVLAGDVRLKLAELDERTGQRLKEFAEGMLQQFSELASRFEVQTVTHEQVRTIEEILGDIADMVDMVYEGSKTIPAAVKERVGESYNHAKGLLAEVKVNKVKLPEVSPLDSKPPVAEVHTDDGQG